MMESRYSTEEAIRLFIDSRDLNGVSAKTIESYDWALKKMLILYPQMLPTKPRDINDILKANSHLSRESLKDLWSRLRTFWRWMEEEEDVQNLMKNIRPPRTPKNVLYRTLEKEEIVRLFNVTTSDRDRAIIAVLLDTGIRVGELASLTRESIRGGRLLVNGKTGQRVVPVSDIVEELLKRQGDERGLWIGLRGRMTVSGLQNVVRRCMRRAGFGMPKIGPHVLRHTFALQYVENGGDAFSLQRILGHTDVKTTMIYVSMADSLVASQHEKFSIFTNLTVPVLTEGTNTSAGTVAT